MGGEQAAEERGDRATGGGYARDFRERLQFIQVRPCFPCSQRWQPRQEPIGQSRNEAVAAVVLGEQRVQVLLLRQVEERHILCRDRVGVPVYRSRFCSWLAVTAPKIGIVSVPWCQRRSSWSFRQVSGVRMPAVQVGGEVHLGVQKARGVPFEAVGAVILPQRARDPLQVGELPGLAEPDPAEGAVGIADWGFGLRWTADFGWWAGSWTSIAMILRNPRRPAVRRGP